MHKVYYQPEGIWVGDIMPYGEDGTFYLYHQRDTRNPEPFGEPFVGTRYDQGFRQLQGLWREP